MCLPLWLRGRLSVNLQAEDILTSISDVLAPEEPNVYRLRDRPTFGAPAERNVLVDEFVEPYISLRWSEELYRLGESINIRSLRD